jgi:hypothetical protein
MKYWKLGFLLTLFGCSGAHYSEGENPEPMPQELQEEVQPQEDATMASPEPLPVATGGAPMDVAPSTGGELVEAPEPEPEPIPEPTPEPDPQPQPEPEPEPEPEPDPEPEPNPRCGEVPNLRYIDEIVQPCANSYPTVCGDPVIDRCPDGTWCREVVDWATRQTSDQCVRPIL